MSKKGIDRAGKALSTESWKSEEQYFEYHIILDEYRKEHLEPLTNVTLKLQEWLSGFKDSSYVIAQRLKRKPQIIKKLRTLSTLKLSQMQDIGGCRIVVDANEAVDKLKSFIENKLARSRVKPFSTRRVTDYREKGRDDTGYRAVHIVIERDKYAVEVQIRSHFQHNWAESVERTSAIYGYQLKSSEGNKAVLDYFKAVSDVYHDVEIGIEIHHQQVRYIYHQQVNVERIIEESEKGIAYVHGINEKHIKAMIAREAYLKAKFINWLLLFNWKKGILVRWEWVSRKADESTEKYNIWESEYSPDEGYEVVLIGTSNIATIQNTHTHYFGIDCYDSILEDIGKSIEKMSKKNQLSKDAKKILSVLYKEKYWYRKLMHISDLRNQHGNTLKNINDAIKELSLLGFIVHISDKSGITLNNKMKKEIEKICN